jgi:hypothetical protein
MSDLPDMPDEQEENESRRKMDPDVRVLAALIRLMEDVDPERRPFFADYLVLRYGR